MKQYTCIQSRYLLRNFTGTIVYRSNLLVDMLLQVLLKSLQFTCIVVIYAPMF